MLRESIFGGSILKLKKFEKLSIYSVLRSKVKVKILEEPSWSREEFGDRDFFLLSEKGTFYGGQVGGTK